MSVAIFVPTLWRAHRLQALIDNVHATTPEPHQLYFMCPEDDGDSIEVLRRSGETFWTDSGPATRENGTYPIRINKMYSLTAEPWIFLGSDDVLFYPGWFTTAATYAASVIATNDLFNLQGTNFLVRRSYIQEQSGCVDIPGVVLYPGYRHNWCDQELVEVARSRDAYAHAWDAVVEHLHWGNDKSPYDPVYAMGDVSSSRDRELYESRKVLWAT